MWYLKHVFGILTLQTGTVLLSTLFITLAVCVLFVNVLSIEAEVSLAWTVMFLFISFTVTIWSIAFKGAYKESNTLMLTATVLKTAYLIIWIILVVMSLVDFPRKKSLCLQSRCPYVLWLSKNPWQESKYKQNQLSNPQYVYGTTMQPNDQPIYEKIFKPQSDRIKMKSKPMKLKKHKTTVRHENIPPEVITENSAKQLLLHKFKTHKAKPVKHDKATKNQGNPIISIIISLIYTVILMFSWLVLNSYRKEIQSQPDVTSNA